MSWFGGNFLAQPGASWPVLDGIPAIPVIQVCVAELPLAPDLIKGKGIFQIFLSQRELPVDLPAENGDHFLVQELEGKGLVPASDAPELAFPRPYQVRWLEGEPEGPVWEDVFFHVDDELIRDHIEESEDPFGTYNDRYFGHSSTKVGGWPTYIQGLAEAPENYVLQVSSEPKPRFGIGDSGNMYFYLSSGGRWSMSWDCY